MCQQGVLVAKKAKVLWNMSGRAVPACQGGDPVLLSLSEAHLECCVQLWAPQDSRDTEQIQGRTTKMMKGLEHLSHDERLRELGHDERLRELGLFSLKKRHMRGDLINV
ncbi:hypothetical protein HGM15179_013056 [Zosterops borbonicus]|uniref:Uncharacterized protein n=1 Tax=Zosterops borbonicus TaxID=364589 RepID=A0A8K1G8P6_9PASS|nr:hypothetical protein HGM15179_013056 [Zosterops borbonicus]